MQTFKGIEHLNTKIHLLTNFTGPLFFAPAIKEIPRFKFYPEIKAL